MQLVKAIQEQTDSDSLLYDYAYVSMSERIDNTDGKKEGYAAIYYECRYSITFKPGQKITIENLN